MLQIPWLDPQQIDFPPVSEALDDPDGLLAAGGDLSPDRLLCAYESGIFPWYDENQPILWWCPNPRTVLFPHKLYISRSLRKTLKKHFFHITMDEAFEDVIRACADHRHKSAGTWITDEMILAYKELFNRGFAHSVEIWDQGELVGGLYGVAMGRCFFGESMFSRQTDASKIALVNLVQQLKTWEYEMVDCQVYSDHLRRFGAETIPREIFMELLARFLHQPGNAQPWQLD